MNQLHDQVLDFMQKYRTNHPEFVYYLRSGKGKSKSKLQQDFWFQGTNRYASVGLYKRTAGNLSTMSISLSFTLSEDILQPKFELHFKNEKNQVAIKIYQAIIERIEGLVKHKDYSFSKSFDPASAFEEVTEFLNKHRPFLDDLVKSKMPEMLIEDEEFYAKLNEIKSLRSSVPGHQGLESGVGINDLNLILYGPPGTGKTYNTIDRAVRIAAPEEYHPDDHESNKKVYDKLVESKQIRFVTFHQSMTYEDFVEGIKPQEAKTESGSINYIVEPGIFRIISSDAMKSVEEKSFDQAYEEFVDWVNENGDFTLKTPSKGKPFFVKVNSMGSFVATPQTGVGTEMVITKDFVREFIYQNEIRDWKPYLIPIVDYFKENFFKYSENGELEDNRQKNFVLIIDEINRGNVSAIFGELITLLESDKRIGKANELSVTLPYSKKRFGVPSNLHLLATMNTADRSVEALDTALRRRFSFIEMPPRYDLPELNREVAGVNLSELLQVINGRIEKLLDKDHLIGHSYFIGVENENDLVRAFKDKIVPLLQEYFYNDFAKIGMVLGKGFIEKNNNEVEFADFEDGANADYENREVFRIIPVNESNLKSALQYLINRNVSDRENG